MPQPTATFRWSLRLRRIIDQRVRAGKARRRGVNPDTLTALVVTLSEQNTEKVKGVASSVTGAGGPRHIAEWEEEDKMLAHGRIDFDAHMSRFTEKRFSRLYRLSKSDFLAFVEEISHTISRTHSRPVGSAESVDPRVMLAVTMWYLGGGQALYLGWPFGIADSTTYQVIDETLEAINWLLKNIHFPETEGNCQREAAAFTRLRNSPLRGIIAALDGIAVGICCPRLSCCPDPPKYYNRMAFFAICVQPCVSASYNISFVSALHAGLTRDSTVFISTPLYTHLSKSEQDGGLTAWCHVAADNAYGNGAAGGRILTPYSGNLTPRRDTFNFYLSSLRILVEQAVGVIVGRLTYFGHQCDAPYENQPS
jgi:DDE superfamily endonuclease